MHHRKSRWPFLIGTFRKNHHLAIFLSVILILVGSFLLWISTFTVPDLSSFEQRKVTQSTKIYDRTGEILLYDVFQNTRRTVVSFDKISPFIKNATVAIEDIDFYRHRGVKISSFIRAVLVNLGAGSYSQGGSTITQQVVKNSILTKEKSIARKLKEWVLSLKLEKVLTKDEILSLYLNESPYGGSIYGVEEASREFFGKSAADVNLAEAAYLAALPQAPTYYSPYGNHRGDLDNRKDIVLKVMFDNNLIDRKQYDQAKKQKVNFLAQGDTGIKAPHFVMFVKEQLEKKYGRSAVEQGGLKVITSLDYSLEQKAEELAKTYALDNEKNFNAENVSIVAINPKTGEILTMVGSRDYFDKAIDGNFNVATAHRQPGSTFKPFAYATAFNKGYTPDTAIFDLQTEFQSTCDPEGKPISPNGDPDQCYMPENYDGKYRGPITMREALAQSINIPAIKTLYLAGIKDSLKTAKDMGITSLANQNQYGLTLVLGGGEVSLLELTSAYSVFANNGIRNPYQAILRVEDKDGAVLEEFSSEPTTVLPKQTSLLISEILSDEKAREPAFGSHSALYFGNANVAVKTGTTNDYKDAWIVGYTPNIAVGAWAGNNDNTPMEKKVAGFIVAPLWHAFMAEVLKVVPSDNFERPDPVQTPQDKPVLRGLWQGGTSYVIDKISGKLATNNTPEELKQEKVVRSVHSILYWIDRNSPLGPKPTRPEDDAQFNLWETPVKKWALSQNLFDESSSTIPTTYDNVHTPENSPRVSITSPVKDSHYSGDNRVVVSANASGKYSLYKADLYINGVLAGSTMKYPFNFTFTPNDLGLVSGTNTIRIVVYDSVLNKGEATSGLVVD